MKRDIEQELLDGFEAIKAGAGIPAITINPDLETNPGGVYLRGIRYRENRTQDQLAAQTGIHRRHLSEMENGKRPIGKENAKKLAKVLNADYRLFL
ncbi:MAG: helix-turn-helix transcriptional regulator [Desulfocapsaceae bacterium]|jgi:plasmid maintenance system antidote protein VapI|nr:helix-turn-helix transcriptional regulator [Desulfocapsaceae bacterium]